MKLKQFGVVYKATTEDWYPSFCLCSPNLHCKPESKLVRINFFAYISRKPYLYRICVTGADDTRMEFDTHDEQRAKNTYKVILMAEDVTKLLLINLGFKYQ